MADGMKLFGGADRLLSSEVKYETFPIFGRPREIANRATSDSQVADGA